MTRPNLRHRASSADARARKAKPLTSLVPERSDANVVAEMAGEAMLRWLSRKFGRIQDALKYFDPDGDGYITRQEWKAGLEQLGYDKVEHADEIFSILDKQRHYILTISDLQHGIRRLTVSEGVAERHPAEAEASLLLHEIVTTEMESVLHDAMNEVLAEALQAPQPPLDSGLPDVKKFLKWRRSMKRKSQGLPAEAEDDDGDLEADLLRQLQEGSPVSSRGSSRKRKKKKKGKGKFRAIGKLSTLGKRHNRSRSGGKSSGSSRSSSRTNTPSSRSASSRGRSRSPGSRSTSPKKRKGKGKFKKSAGMLGRFLASHSSGFGDASVASSRSASSKRGGPSPKRGGKSPSASSKAGSQTPQRGGRSPMPGSTSSKIGSPSPKRGGRSPMQGSTSSRIGSRSPQRGGRSPVPGSTSSKIGKGKHQMGSPSSTGGQWMPSGTGKRATSLPHAKAKAKQRPQRIKGGSASGKSTGGKPTGTKPGELPLEGDEHDVSRTEEFEEFEDLEAPSVWAARLGILPADPAAPQKQQREEPHVSHRVGPPGHSVISRRKQPRELLPFCPQRPEDMMKTYGHIFQLLNDPHVKKRMPKQKQSVHVSMPRLPGQTMAEAEAPYRMVPEMGGSGMAGSRSVPSLASQMIAGTSTAAGASFYAGASDTQASAPFLPPLAKSAPDRRRPPDPLGGDTRRGIWAG